MELKAVSAKSRVTSREGGCGWIVVHRLKVDDIHGHIIIQFDFIHVMTFTIPSTNRRPWLLPLSQHFHFYFYIYVRSSQPLVIP